MSLTDHQQHGSDASHRMVRRESEQSGTSLSASIEDTIGSSPAPPPPANSAPQEPDFENGSFEKVTEVYSNGVTQLTNLLPGSAESLTVSTNTCAGADLTNCLSNWEYAGTVNMRLMNTNFTRSGPTSGGTAQRNYLHLATPSDTGGVYVGLESHGASINQTIYGHVVSTSPTSGACKDKDVTARDTACTYYKLSFYGASQPLRDETNEEKHYISGPPRRDKSKLQNGTLEISLSSNVEPLEKDGDQAHCRGTNALWCETQIEVFTVYEIIYSTTNAAVNVKLENKSPTSNKFGIPFPIIAVDRFQIDECDSAYYPTDECPDTIIDDANVVAPALQCGAVAGASAKHYTWRDC